MYYMDDGSADASSGALTVWSSPTAGSLLEHVAVLGPLAPSTTYSYVVVSSTGALSASRASFTTAPAQGTRPSTPTRVWMVGDVGSGTVAQASVRDGYLGSASPRGNTTTALQATDVFLLVGDNAYMTGSDAQFSVNLFAPYATVLAATVAFPVFGNHDGLSAQSATQTGPYYTVFSPPSAGQLGGVPSGTKAYYSFDHGNIHFVILNSYDVPR